LGHVVWDIRDDKSCDPRHDGTLADHMKYVHCHRNAATGMHRSPYCDPESRQGKAGN
jgi:hypothetical protein